MQSSGVLCCRRICSQRSISDSCRLQTGLALVQIEKLNYSSGMCSPCNPAFVTIDSATLLYTYISRFSVTPHYQQQFYLRPSFITFFNFSHKRPTFTFTSESGYTLGFAQRIAHKGLHAETRVFQMGGIITLGAFHTVRKPCVARG